MAKAVGRPGGLVCLAAKMTDFSGPVEGSNDIGTFAGLPFTFSQLAINPSIGTGTGYEKTVDRTTNGGVDGFSVSGPGMTGIPYGDI